MSNASLKPDAKKIILGLIAGLWPFLILGPLQVLLSYPFPPLDWRRSEIYQVIITLLGFLPLFVGFIIGWLHRFPPWSFPYLCIAAILVIALPFNLFSGILIPAFGMLGLILLLFWLTRSWKPFHSLFRIIHADWTLLSFGLYIIPIFFFAAIDYEEDPALTFFVISPSLTLLIAALGALISPNKRSRAMALAIGIVLAIAIRMVGGKWFYLMYGLLSALFVFAPALIELSRKPETSSLSSTPKGS